MLYSEDAYHWKDLNKVLLAPTIGKQKVMRDPSIAQYLMALFTWFGPVAGKAI
jgi:hypothetical protein